MKKLIASLFIAATMCSCAELQTIADQALNEFSQPQLTSFDVSNGLKSALKIGSVNSANILSATDGFYKDQAAKILLPPEAQQITKNIKLIPGGTKLVDAVELRLNRAAEDAVKQAAPIFASAISSMSIADAFGILRGGQGAATNYLKSKTSVQLKQMFMPKVRESLNKNIVGNISTNKSWEALTGRYNKVANSFAGKLASLQPVNTKLDDYVADMALKSLFAKVAIEENKIRKDPMARVNGILKKVFGELDK